MRCPDCSKFVAYADEPEVEIDSEDTPDSEYTAQFTVKLVCGECSTDLKSTELEVTVDIDHECAALKVDNPEYDFEIESSEIEPTDRYETHDRKGKPIKSSRFQKHYYGARINAEVRCNHCQEIIQIEAEDDCQASGFDELV